MRFSINQHIFHKTLYHGDSQKQKSNFGKSKLDEPTELKMSTFAFSLTHCIEMCYSYSCTEQESDLLKTTSWGPDIYYSTCMIQRSELTDTVYSHNKNILPLAQAN